MVILSRLNFDVVTQTSEASVVLPRGVHGRWNPEQPICVPIRVFCLDWNIFLLEPGFPMNFLGGMSKIGVSTNHGTIFSIRGRVVRDAPFLHGWCWWCKRRTFLEVGIETLPVPATVTRKFGPIIVVFRATTVKKLSIDCGTTAYNSSIGDQERAVVHVGLWHRCQVVQEFWCRSVT